VAQEADEAAEAQATKDEGQVEVELLRPAVGSAPLISATGQ